MKKWLFAIFCVLCFGMIACKVNENVKPIEQESAMLEATEEAEENVGDNSKVLLEEDIPVITLRILISNSAEPQMNMLQQYDAAMTESANQYLQEKNKKYRVLYQTVQMKSEFPESDDLEGADIICTRIPPEQAELYYVDIAKELKGDELRKIYESVPELYWERVNVNGAIYSLLATPPASQMIYVDNVIELSRLGLEVPDELIGQPIEEWEGFVSEVHNKTGETAYIMYTGYGDNECPVAAGSAWNARFQLVLPFIGIDFEHPETGVQCIYESEYGQKIQKIWSQWCEKGYISDGRTEMKWRIGSGYDVNMREIDTGKCQYPLQNAMYASPQVAGVSYYTSGISKESQQIELVYEFLNDLAMDDELHEAMIRVENENVWYHIIPTTLIVEDNGQGIYNGTLEENRQVQDERFQTSKMPPAPGFVFDAKVVQKEVDAIMTTLSSQNLYGKLKAMEESGTAPQYAVEIHYISQEIMDILYEQGLQTVLDEANRQLEEYLNQ